LTDADKKLEKLVLSVNATDATTKMSQFQNWDEIKLFLIWFLYSFPVYTSYFRGLDKSTILAMPKGSHPRPTSHAHGASLTNLFTFSENRNTFDS
jgi:hypothetical protein